MSKVTMIVDPNTSEISFDIDGVIGPSCKTITDLLTQSMEIVEEKEKEEFMMTADLPDYIENME